MRKSAHRGFTLIEILIVISIIAILASLILGGVSLARKKTYMALAQSQVSNLNSALKRYVQDTGMYPGSEYKDGENAFPVLFEALCGEKPPKGKGGPSAPYVEIKEADIAVYDAELDDYRQATSDEIYDPRVPKYLRDPWNMPYIYRENKSRSRREYMHGRDADIYSTGPDTIDQTLDGEKGEGGETIDDIGSW